MKTLVIIFCLIPSVAFSATQLSFKDGSSVCGSYVEDDKTYCRPIIGGDICFKKTEITLARTVSECGDPEIGAQGKGTDYLKKNALTPLDLSVRSREKEKKAQAYK
ncbi:MAG: hypothetical protein AABZ15_07445 [Nitrospirota bacterium]